MSVAVRHAVSRGELEKDPFRNIRRAPDTRKEKGVLTPAEVAALIHAPENPMAKVILNRPWKGNLKRSVYRESGGPRSIKAWE
jgi:hypothetical protein